MNEKIKDMKAGKKSDSKKDVLTSPKDVIKLDDDHFGKF